MKIIKFVATRCQILRLKCTKFDFGTKICKFRHHFKVLNSIRSLMCVCVLYHRSTDFHMPHYPLTVVFDLRHNHPIAAGDVLRCRDVGPEARATITQLLQDNHSPSSALEKLKYDLQSQHPNDYLQLCGDRYHCPDLKWCYRYTYVY